MFKKSLTCLICVHSLNEIYDNYLISALKSLESQTYKNFKTLIILDECWSKTSEKILTQNLNIPIEIKIKEKKRGLTDCKNFGLSFINTDLVCFLDGDDLYIENKIEKQLSFFEKNDVDFLGTQSWNIKKNNEMTLFDSCFKLGEHETHLQIKNVIKHYNCLTHGSMMIKMDCLKEINYYRNIKGQEDWDLWKRAFDYGFKFHQLQERLYVYRLNSSVNR